MFSSLAKFAVLSLAYLSASPVATPVCGHGFITSPAPRITFPYGNSVSTPFANYTVSNLNVTLGPVQFQLGTGTTFPSNGFAPIEAYSMNSCGSSATPDPGFSGTVAATWTVNQNVTLTWRITEGHAGADNGQQYGIYIQIKDGNNPNSNFWTPQNQIVGFGSLITASAPGLQSTTFLVPNLVTNDAVIRWLWILNPAVAPAYFVSCTDVKIAAAAGGSTSGGGNCPKANGAVGVRASMAGVLAMAGAVAIMMLQ